MLYCSPIITTLLLLLSIAVDSKLRFDIEIVDVDDVADDGEGMGDVDDSDAVLILPIFLCEGTPVVA